MHRLQHASHIEVACTRCERRGRYRLSKLIASYGEDFPMTDLGAEIAACPRRYAAVTERWYVYYPGLRQIMYDGEQHTSEPVDEDD
ncbi:hypothetical protein DAMDJJ_08635 [Cupriavidus necator]